MNLTAEIKPDFLSSISITDYTLEFGEYISEDTEEVLLHYYHFKYSETCTINVVKYISSEGEDLLYTYFSPHDIDNDLLRFKLPKDGYYSVYHIVLPTVQWYDKVAEEDLSEYLAIYVTDGRYIYKVINNLFHKVDVEEILEVNSERTTISRLYFKVFSVDRLKHCYAKTSLELLKNYTGRCSNIDEGLRFKRDFLMMSLHVIMYHIEWDEYSAALLIIENIYSCGGMCKDFDTSFTKITGGCGCSK